MNDAIWKGLLLGIACQLGCIVVSVVLSPMMNFIPFMAWSLLQWIALFPLWRWYKGRGMPHAATGVLIVGFVGMLLNGACTAWVLTGGIRIGG